MTIDMQLISIVRLFAAYKLRETSLPGYKVTLGAATFMFELYKMLATELCCKSIVCCRSPIHTSSSYVIIVVVVVIMTKIITYDDECVCADRSAAFTSASCITEIVEIAEITSSACNSKRDPRVRQRSMATTGKPVGRLASWPAHFPLAAQSIT